MQIPGFPLTSAWNTTAICIKELKSPVFSRQANSPLEVSSPGTDEPLRFHRQYLKNRGRKVEVLLQDGSRKEGKLVEVSQDGIIIEEHRGNKKKKEMVMHTILFDNIKSTKDSSSILISPRHICRRTKNVVMASINLIEAFQEFKDAENIDRPTMMKVVEDVFKTLLRKKYGSDENFDVIVNAEKGDLEIMRRRTDC